MHGKPINWREVRRISCATRRVAVGNEVRGFVVREGLARIGMKG
jgi:hypothetical protein